MATYPQRWSDPSPGQSRRRGGALLLAIVVHLLLILLLLRLAPPVADRERSGAGLKTFQVATAKTATTATKRARAAPRRQASTAAAAARPKAIHQPSKVHEQEDTNAEAEAIWSLGRGMFRKADIAKIPSAKQGDADAEVAEAGGGGEGDQAGPGAGPGGRKLYAAQWYVEPRDAELRTYLPRSIAPSSWAEIACQTATNYRVENCRELQQSPPGSGLSRALRQAAWQFKVLPPRVNGKQMIGTWVRIHFDFTEGGVSVRR